MSSPGDSKADSEEETELWNDNPQSDAEKKIPLKSSSDSSSSGDEEDDGEVQPTIRLLPMRPRVIKTVAIMFCFFCLGMSSASYGPILVTLEIILDTNTTTLSMVFVCRSLGFLFGSILCGVLYARLQSDLLNACGMVCAGVAIMTLPVSAFVYILMIISAFEGFGRSIPDTAGNPYLLGLWAGHKAKDPLLQCLHGVWSIGSTLAPFIIAPFLMDISNNLHLDRTNASRSLCFNRTYMGDDEVLSTPPIEYVTLPEDTSLGYEEFARGTAAYDLIGDLLDLRDNLEERVNQVAWILDDNTTWIRNENCSRRHLFDVIVDVDEIKWTIFKPFILFGTFALLSSVSFFVLYGMSKPVCPPSCTKISGKKSSTDQTTQESNKQFRTKMLALLFFFFFFYVWVEGIPGRFAAAFIVKGLGWRNKYGAILTAIYWGFHGVARLIGIFLATVVKPRTMIIGNMVVTSVAVVLLLFSASFSAIPWLAIGLLGFGLSTMFATVILWTDDYVEITGSASAVILAGASSGSVLAPIPMGLLFDNYGHMWFAYVLCISNFLMIALFVATYFYARKHGVREKIDVDESTGRHIPENMFLQSIEALS